MVAVCRNVDWIGCDPCISPVTRQFTPVPYSTCSIKYMGYQNWIGIGLVDPTKIDKLVEGSHWTG